MKKTILILFIATSQFAFSQTTDFTFSSTNNACLPIDVQFTQNSSGTPKGYLWDFGNGARSNLANPMITYTSPGNYTVRLITVYENNTAQRTRTITIHNAIATNFNADRSLMCSPGTVIFTANSSGSLANYTWDFGDATPHVITGANNISHNFTDYGEFNVTLTATSTSGCAVTASRTIKIIRPTITASITTPLLGCIPMTTDFTSSVNVATGGNVISYAWDFGDGNIINSGTAGISHIYNEVGSFGPKLTITTSEGCSSSFNFDSLAFGRPPINNIAYPVNTVYCGSETARFISTTTTANRYDWDFDGSGNISSVTDTMAEHRYNNLGFKDVTVTPLHNGCPGNPTTFRIEIIGVIARFKYANTCLDKKTFKFENTSQGHISTTYWTLGAQGYSHNPDTVSKTYPASGTFGVRLLITDDITGCVDSFKTKIYTANPVMKNNDVSICINSDTRFSVTNNYANPALTYLWNILGLTIGPGIESTPIVHADSLGHFNNNLVILNNGSQYCPDTVHLDHSISVRGPQLDFTAAPSICMNVPLSVVNLSHAYQPSDTIQTWAWNFGRPEYNDNAFQPQPFLYTYPKLYHVKLSATDIFGCTDSMVKTVIVRPMPFLWIIPHTVDMCQGQQKELIGYTSDDILWTPASAGFCTTCDTTIVTPAHTTRFIAIATNSFGCITTDSALVKVTEPFTAAALTPNASICEGDRGIQLDVNPRGKVIVWSPSTGLSDINIYNPVATPTQTTAYRATLTDSVGCFSSFADISITVKSKPSVNAGPDKVLAYNTSFTLSPDYSSNIESWIWSPADSLSCTNCPNPMGNALTSTTYQVQVTSDSGCVARGNVTIFVECKGANIYVPNAFTPNNDGRNDYMHPITRGIQTIKRFAVFNRAGQMMYEVGNISMNKESSVWGWDGKFKGKEQEQGAYVYFIESVCDVGQTIFSKGSFVLIR